jgi:hypothetical protein
VRPSFQQNRSPSDFCNWGRFPGHAAQRRSAEGDDPFRLHEAPFFVEPPAASVDFRRLRFLVETQFSPRLELEMLDGAGDEHLRAVQPDARKRLIENLPGWPDEGSAAQIFLIAGLFANEHQGSMSGSLARDRLSRAAVKRTTLTLRLGLCKRGKASKDVRLCRRRFDHLWYARLRRAEGRLWEQRFGKMVPGFSGHVHLEEALALPYGALAPESAQPLFLVLIFWPIWNRATFDASHKPSV